MNIKFSISGQKISILERPTTISYTNELEAEFSFSNEWAGRQKTAIFKRTGIHAIPVLIENDKCIVPKEVLRNCSKFEVGVIAGNIHTTNIVEVYIDRTCYNEDAEIPDPTPSIYDQIIEKLESIIKGGEGGIGPQGPQGPKGDDGKSAYQIAVDNGYVGTESEWLASLKGDKGDKGADGTMTFADLTDEQKESLRGPQGPQGPGAEVATIDTAGIVKPDGTSITVDEDGTIHAETNTESGGFSPMTNEEFTEMYNNIYDSIFNSGSSNVSVSSVSISGDSSLNINNSIELTATISPSNATNKEVTWSIDSNTYATITPNGNKCTVTAKDTEGAATVTVTTSDGNKTDSKTISIISDADIDHNLSGKKVIATKYPYNQTFLTLYISTKGLSDGETITVTGGFSDVQNIKELSNNVTAYSATSKVVSENQNLSTQVSSKLIPSGTLSNFVLTGTLNAEVSNFDYIRVPVTINPLDTSIETSYTIDSLTVAVNGVKKDIVAYGNLLATESTTIE